MNLLAEIRADLVNQDASISNTLRKAKILASSLKLDEFKDWIKHELEGYPGPDQLPDYRRSTPTNLGTFTGPFQGKVTNMVIPTYNLEKPVKEFAENLYFFDGVGELEGMLKAKGDSMQRRWPQEFIILSRDKLTLSGGYTLVDATQPIGKHIIEGILDNVKNKLLDFILALEESNIPIDEKEIKPENRDQIRNMFNINVYGNNNVVAGGENVRQEANSIVENDIAGLIAYFRQNKIHEEDLDSLKIAIKEDGTITKKAFGNKVKAWLGTMIAKAASGIWQVALNAAPAILISGLNKYYGL